MNLKILITCCVLLIPFCVKSQTINLDFEPQGKVIEFHFDSLIIYTDTNSLFKVYSCDNKNSNQVLSLRVRKLILKEIQNSNNDTLVFTGNSIPFNDNIEDEKNWDLNWAFIHLIKNKKIKIFDKQGNQVRKIITRKVGTKKDGPVRRLYISKETNEILFYEMLYRKIRQTITPRF